MTVDYEEFHPSPNKAISPHNASKASFAALAGDMGYLDAADCELVRQAYRFADEAHLGQLRNSGDPYITHPLAVAKLCTTWRLDAQALMAALLHDVMEDCQVSKAELVERFGPAVANLVDGLTKLDKLQFHTREESQAENFRKMLLAMAQDVRVILIKLADRTHNMRTLGDVPRAKWKRIAQETLDVYMPIAHRLGLHPLYRELQDLSFRHLMPWRYQTIAKAVHNARKRRRDLINTVQEQVNQAFAMARVQLDISGREKTLYSIYLKMSEKRMSFSQLSDIYGFRVIVPTVTDCYTALGIVHQMYRPVPGRFKDYIAIPKANAYQSLHTTLVGPAGLHIEFQFRTDAMNAVAEGGVAAHWQYKLEQPSAPSEHAGMGWVQSLLDIQNETRDAAEFWEHVKVDLFPDEVYVFTPRGNILALPRGVTVVDFAYAIHTNLGDKTVAAKINGEQAPLRTVLKNGDMVEVITTNISCPNPDWLTFVRTARARSKIRHYLKAQEHGEAQVLGEKLLQQALRAEGYARLPDTKADKTVWDKLVHLSGCKNHEELFKDIGLGKKVASIMGKRLASLLSAQGHKPSALVLSQAHFNSEAPITQAAIQLDGNENGATIQYAPCCLPVPGDDIVGYMGHGEGLSVHRSACPHAIRLQNRDKERFIPVEWASDIQHNFQAIIKVDLHARRGGLAKLAAVVARNEADIVHLQMGEEGQFSDVSDMELKITVRNLEHLLQVLRSLEREEIVISAKRALAENTQQQSN